MHVHDLVDFVSAESEKAGKAAGEYIQHGAFHSERVLDAKPGDCIGYIVPQRIRFDAIGSGSTLSFRVRNVGENVAIEVR